MSCTISGARESRACISAGVYNERGGIGADGQFMGGGGTFVLGIEYFITHKTCFEE